MNRVVLPQAGESQRPLWFCLHFSGGGADWPGPCGKRGRRSEYYVLVGYLTKTMTCWQRMIPWASS